MLIAISGVPGTGKTAVAKQLAKLLDAQLLSINDLVKENKIPSSYDRLRKARIVDESKLSKNMRALLDPEKTTIVEGLLAHFLDADFVIILRTRPGILKKRLVRKKWSKKKIAENVEAELVGVAIAEAMDLEKNVYEIDTTGKKAKDVAATIKKILNNLSIQKRYRTGRIDWLSDMMKEFRREKNR